MNKKIIFSLFLIIGSLCLSAQKTMKVSHIAYTVSDTKTAVNFLKKTVSAKENSTTTIEGKYLQSLFGIDDKQLKVIVTSMFIGEEEIRLLEFSSSKSEGREIPEDSNSNDLRFQHMAVVVKDMDTAYNKVKELSVEHVSTAPQKLPEYIPAAAGISAFYFRDKDDHNIELIHFPKDKGDPKWQKSTEEQFLGIDHTAIAVASTTESLKFYKGILGLEIAGTSENYGTEQEHLNQVFGARLLITGMDADKGIGVEFLQYIAPSGGKPYPKNSSALDHWHWHTAMQVNDLESIFKKLKTGGYEIVSSSMQSIPELKYKKALVVRDPDGHAVLLYEK